ncbi:aromatic-L-amino-acid decarboxylase-like [Ptychodera flava]|uniref:aromatic-L-amino-acid decarboxylase-like n=1 Tax=Ptychodera flava TaxID=63121 RepID=UPI00396A9C85
MNEGIGEGNSTLPTEAQSSALRLDTDAKERRMMTQKVMNFAERHLQKVEKRQVPCFEMKEDKGAGLLECAIEEEPKDLEKLLEIYDEHVLSSGTQDNHGGYMGFVVGGGVYPAALGDFLGAVTNRLAAGFLNCPGAVRMENMLIDWVARLFDFPSEAAGNLTSGGSTATVLALMTARHSKQLRGRDFERAVVYMTEMCHACVLKALKTIGLAEAVIRKVPMDASFRMDSKVLRQMVGEDKEASLLPFLVAATIGTTNVGSVDPIDEIADVAEEYNLWFHVDAAYGGFFVLVDELKDHFKGVNRADSLIVNPHKSLFLPFGSGMVIVRDGNKLREANASPEQPTYLQDMDGECQGKAPRDLSFELCRNFRGLRMWTPLQLYGVGAFRQALKEKIALNRYVYRRLQEIPDIVVDGFPQLVVLTFHFETGGGISNEIFNKAVHDKILEDGSFFLSSTRLREEYRLRICTLHLRCHKEVIDDLCPKEQEKTHVVGVWGCTVGPPAHGESITTTQLMSEL